MVFFIRIGIGIDTGGTYTDAAVIDFENGTVAATSKALTTKQDLSVGILEALDALPAGYLKSAGVIALSTTLATNACVEGRGGNAALVFFGGDRRVIDKYGGEYGLPPSAEMHIQESYATFSGGFDREPDWDMFRAAVQDGFKGLDGVGIIEKYAMKNSAVIERKARDIFREARHIPVVCGHELFSGLNSLQRGSSTLLNARLFPVIREFLDAISKALGARGIDAPVFIVRSDASLMSDEFANFRPVETLICGPAASVVGSAYLASQENSVIVDMGGTTTDVALVQNGVPLKAAGGVQVGKWKTFVSGLYIKTFGLGGDSAVHYNDRDAYLEEYRVVPLCVAAERHPRITENLQALLGSGKKHMKYLHEHFILIRGITGDSRYTDAEKALCLALEKGPLSLREAAESVPGGDVFTFNAARLLRDGVIQCAGLTPTDVMHIQGDFVRFPVEPSELGARFVARNLDVTLDGLCGRVYEEIKRKLYLNIVKALLENNAAHYMRDGVGRDVERVIRESYDMARGSGRAGSGGGAFQQPGKLISYGFKTGFTLTGVGAPIRIFLPDVAKMLGTHAVIPDHYEVANAIGAIAGGVTASYEVNIRPNYSVAGVTGYTVSGLSETQIFASAAEAESFAAAEAEQGARLEAERRGARGEISVTVSKHVDEAAAGFVHIHLGTRIVARAIGAAGLKPAPPGQTPIANAN